LAVVFRGYNRHQFDQYLKEETRQRRERVRALRRE
jgi:hypothetical protein